MIKRKPQNGTQNAMQVVDVIILYHMHAGLRFLPPEDVPV